MRIRCPFLMYKAGARIILGCFQDMSLTRACCVCLATYTRIYVSCEILFIIFVVLARLITFLMSARAREYAHSTTDQKSSSRLFLRKSNDRYGEAHKIRPIKYVWPFQRPKQPFIISIAVKVGFIELWNVYFAVKNLSKITRRFRFSSLHSGQKEQSN